MADGKRVWSATSLVMSIAVNTPTPGDLGEDVEVGVVWGCLLDLCAGRVDLHGEVVDES